MNKFILYITLLLFPLYCLADSTIVEIICNTEGFKSFPYTDTKNVLTIGYGINIKDKSNTEWLELNIGQDYINILESKGISKDKALDFVKWKIKQSETELYVMYNNFCLFPYNVRSSLILMHYNLGINKMKKFVNMNKALSNFDYNKASNEMINSKWYKDCPNLVIYLSNLMKGC